VATVTGAATPVTGATPLAGRALSTAKVNVRQRKKDKGTQESCWEGWLACSR
jgi:hypothetical protein